MTPTDREACERAIGIYREKGPAERAQIEHLLKRDPWERCGQYAAACCQSKILHLKLWQDPPCWANLANLAHDDGVMGDHAAAKLLQKMIAAGLSRYEPDPLGAIAEVAARYAAERKAKETV